MSLKNFHIAFITLSSLGSFAFGLWCLLTRSGARVAGSLTMGSVSLIAGIALLVYGCLFIRKLNRERIR